MNSIRKSKRGYDSEFTVEKQLYVPKALYGGLIGRGGQTKSRIESESDVRVVVPQSRKQKDAMITIEGRCDEDICKAEKAIETLVLSLRKRHSPTHFTCVPALTETLKNAHKQIKDEILADNYEGIDETLFIDEGRIHVTFAPCTLLDSIDTEKAIEVFKDCCKELVDNKTSIVVNVRGIKKFDDASPKKVRVLFAGIESPTLQAFANKVLKSFKDAKLSFEDRGDDVKLHMTLMNTKYRTKVNEDAPRFFDASDILQKYGDYDFGSFSVGEFHLSEMGSKDEKGFYKSLCTVSLSA